MGTRRLETFEVAFAICTQLQIGIVVLMADLVLVDIRNTKVAKAVITSL